MQNIIHIKKIIKFKRYNIPYSNALMKVYCSKTKSSMANNLKYK